MVTDSCTKATRLQPLQRLDCHVCIYWMATLMAGQSTRHQRTPGLTARQPAWQLVQQLLKVRTVRRSELHLQWLRDDVQEAVDADFPHNGKKKKKTCPSPRLPEASGRTWWRSCHLSSLVLAFFFFLQHLEDSLPPSLCYWNLSSCLKPLFPPPVFVFPTQSVLHIYISYQLLHFCSRLRVFFYVSSPESFVYLWYGHKEMCEKVVIACSAEWDCWGVVFPYPRCVSGTLLKSMSCCHRNRQLSLASVVTAIRREIHCQRHLLIC